MTDKSLVRAWYSVFILLLAFVFSFIDRIILSLLVGPIKADLNVSDSAMGFLMGLAFAIFYTLLGLPIARLADRYSRRLIIGTGVFLWSMATAACGLARNYTQLLLARIGIGVGEAALSPAAYSMIADLFPKEQIGRAISVYQSGAFFGAAIAFSVGGAVIGMTSGVETLDWPIVGSIKPWQAAFIIVGLPGVLMAALMATIREPARKAVGRIEWRESIAIPGIQISTALDQRSNDVVEAVQRRTVQGCASLIVCGINVQALIEHDVDRANDIGFVFESSGCVLLSVAEAGGYHQCVDSVSSRQRCHRAVFEQKFDRGNIRRFGRTNQRRRA